MRTLTVAVAYWNQVKETVLVMRHSTNHIPGCDFSKEMLLHELINLALYEDRVGRERTPDHLSSPTWPGMGARLNLNLPCLFIL